MQVQPQGLAPALVPGPQPLALTCTRQEPPGAMYSLISLFKSQERGVIS